MTRMLSILILVVTLFQTILLPAAARADCHFKVHIDFETLPATRVTASTAVINGKVCQTIRVKLSEPAPHDWPWVFEYGTRPGVYTHKVPADIVSETAEYGTDGDYVWLRMCVYFKANVQNLDPCENYYVRFVYLGYLGGHINDPCFTFSPSKEVRFTTTGCGIGVGQGSTGTAASMVATWPRPVEMSNIIVQSASIAATTISPGQSVNVSAAVINKGTADGDARISLYVNGEEVESRGVAVAAGQTTPIDFQVTRNEPGTYAVYVGNVPAGSLTVDSFANNDVLIYGIIGLFILGIAGTLYLVLRRRSA